jgi:catechol 2,3-dioxygenase-like lactoylglutathione lyase family enzyme
MIDHIGICPADLERSRHFYNSALGALGIRQVMEITPDQSGGYHGIGYGDESKPVFWLSTNPRYAIDQNTRRDGMHLAFKAESRAAVDAFYAAALENGGHDNGGPGIRPHYHPAYYAAFVIDPDGINVEAVCHKPEPGL